jgi:translation initiation factor 2 subunit 3
MWATEKGKNFIEVVTHCLASTLVEGLSGIKPIKFDEEKERNITIKLGYANFKIYQCLACPKPMCFKSWKSAEKREPTCSRCQGPMKLVRHISFVDCPGHDYLMQTMLNGAAIMDSALLVVAANAKCPQPQTSEHVRIY